MKKQFTAQQIFEGAAKCMATKPRVPWIDLQALILDLIMAQTKKPSKMAARLRVIAKHHGLKIPEWLRVA
jgi:hypothetical protein